MEATGSQCSGPGQRAPSEEVGVLQGLALAKLLIPPLPSPLGRWPCLLPPSEGKQQDGSGCILWPQTYRDS